MPSQNRNRSALPFVLLLWTFPAFGQPPQRSPVPTKKAPAKQAKKASAPASPIYASTNFDLSLDRLPAQYQGHDIAKVYNALEEIQQQGTKSEFETTAQWHERAETLKLRPIIAGMNTQSIWAFTVLFAKSTYDADRQVLDVFVDVSPTEGRATITARLESKDGSSYVGMNAFGAVRDVSRSESTFREISLTNSSSFELVKHKEDVLGSPQEWTAFHAPVQIAAENAKELRDNLTALVVCRLTEPFVEHRDTYDPATFRSPYSTTHHFRNVVAQAIEVWIVDQGSGTVYAKIQPRD